MVSLAVWKTQISWKMWRGFSFIQLHTTGLLPNYQNGLSAGAHCWIMWKRWWHTQQDLGKISKGCGDITVLGKLQDWENIFTPDWYDWSHINHVYKRIDHSHIYESCLRGFQVINEINLAGWASLTSSYHFYSTDELKLMGWTCITVVQRP